MASDESTTYRFEYDAGDRLRKEVRPDGVERQMAYGVAGDLSSIEMLGSTRPGSPERPRRTTRFGRDAMGRLLEQSTETATIAYVWDGADRLKQVERTPTKAGTAMGIGANTVRFEYDKAGRLVAEHGADGAVEYTLDELDTVAGLRLPHGPRIDTLTYGSGHVHQIRCGEQVVSDFERDDLHREVMRTQGRLTHRVGYDALGRRAWQSAGTSPETLGPGQGRLWRSYRYTPSGELLDQEDSLRGAIDYRYDPAGHLLEQSRRKDRREEQFAWDAAGNLLDRIADGSRKSTGKVEGNRLMAWQDIRFEYDPWGNLITKTSASRQTQRFDFDAEGRLVRVRTGSARGQIETSFDYDALGRRIGRTDKHTDSPGATPYVEQLRFVWQGLRLAQEIRTTGVSSYVYSPEAAYTPLARVDAIREDVDTRTGRMMVAQAKGVARVLHFHTDLVGTPLEVTDEAGELAWAGKHKAWGKVERQEDPILTPHTAQPLRYPGQYADDTTGLHYNTFRYYDPEVGRFISQDPIGLIGGDNLYAYAPSSTGWIDPLGLASLGQLGTYGSLNSDIHVGDGLQAHELIRHEYLVKEGLANSSRLGGNPSIALSNDYHTRGPTLDSRGIGGAHYHEGRIRAEYGLGKNDFHSNPKVELDITQGAIRKAGIPANRARQLRQQANQFLKKLRKVAAGNGC